MKIKSFPRLISTDRYFENNKIEYSFQAQLSPQIGEFFNVQKPTYYTVMKIYENYLHTSDSVDYVFDLEIEDLSQRRFAK